jgi:hypothetical protein
MQRILSPNVCLCRNSKKNALLPVVAEEDAVRVEHGQDLEDDVFAQRQRHRVAAHQEVYQACGHTHQKRLD